MGEEGLTAEVPAEGYIPRRGPAAGAGGPEAVRPLVAHGSLEAVAAEVGVGEVRQEGDVAVELRQAVVVVVVAITQPGEGQRVEGGKLPEGEVDPVLVVPAVLARLVIEVEACRGRELMSAAPLVAVAEASLQVEAGVAGATDIAQPPVGHYALGDGIDVVGGLVEVAVVVTDEALLHGAVALGDVRVLGAYVLGLATTVLDGAEDAGR